MKYIAINHERFIVDLMYARSDNMTKHAVYQEVGWGKQAVVHIDLWKNLLKAVPLLQEKKLKMKICDAYRLPVAHERLKELIPMDGFFAPTANRSLHCHAAAVDVCLCAESGEELPYPTKVDCYNAIYADKLAQGNDAEFREYLQKARHDFMGATIEQIENRKFLKELMEQIGMKSLAHEWWHYNLPISVDDKKYPLITLSSKDFEI